MTEREETVVPDLKKSEIAARVHRDKPSSSDATRSVASKVVKPHAVANQDYSHV